MVNIMLSLHEYYVDKLKEFDKVRNLFDENYDKYIPLVLDIFGTLLTAIQPIWCNYPDAVDVLGCWSLVGKSRKKISREYCKSCDCYVDN